jgi:lipooligosaccharide transport system permease protein
MALQRLLEPKRCKSGHAISKTSTSNLQEENSTTMSELYISLQLAWHVVVRNWVVYRKDFLANISPTLADPALMMASLGMGLSPFIGHIDGLTYAQYLAPGLVAITALFTAFFECSYGFYVRMTFESVFKAMLTTPIGVREVVIGEFLWVFIRASSWQPESALSSPSWGSYQMSGPSLSAAHWRPDRSALRSDRPDRYGLCGISTNSNRLFLPHRAHVFSLGVFFPLTDRPILGTLCISRPSIMECVCSRDAPGRGSSAKLSSTWPRCFSLRAFLVSGRFEDPAKINHLDV